jgi:hypothetical protein
MEGRENNKKGEDKGSIGFQFLFVCCFFFSFFPEGKISPISPASEKYFLSFYKNNLFHNIIERKVYRHATKFSIV